MRKLGRYPEAIVAYEPTGPTGNAYYILGMAERQLLKAGATKDECEEYLADAMSDDYEHLLAVTREWVTLIEVE
jgi:hypothetical protein